MIIIFPVSATSKLDSTFHLDVSEGGRGEEVHTLAVILHSLSKQEKCEETWVACN